MGDARVAPTEASYGAVDGSVKSWLAIVRFTDRNALAIARMMGGGSLVVAPTSIRCRNRRRRWSLVGLRGAYRGSRCAYGTPRAWSESTIRASESTRRRRRMISSRIAITSAAVGGEPAGRSANGGGRSSLGCLAAFAPWGDF